MPALVRTGASDNQIRVMREHGTAETEQIRGATPAGCTAETCSLVWEAGEITRGY